MTPFELAGLKWLADRIADIGGGWIGDRLRAKTSSENARDASFALFTALGELQSASDKFIEALKLLERSPDNKSARSDLSNALRPVRDSLEDVDSALRRVDPQLEIFAPAVEVRVVEARGARAMVLTQAEDALATLDVREGDEDLGSLVRKAEKAGATIRAGTESVRAFLANEFEFKDTFKGKTS
jgi:hypothetical protein